MLRFIGKLVSFTHIIRASGRILKISQHSQKSRPQIKGVFLETRCRV